MEDFYRKILNIKSVPNIEAEIVKALAFSSENIPEDLEGMCKIHSFNIQNQLAKKGITSYKINSLDIGGTYEHHFVLVDEYSNNKLYLVDKTFNQFNDTNRVLINNKLTDLPAKILKQTPRGKKLYASLTKKGYQVVEIEDIYLYLNSLGIENKGTLDNLILNSNNKSYF